MKPAEKIKPPFLLIWPVVFVLVFALGSPNHSVVQAKKPTNQPSKKVSLCHKTNSQSNPYVFITVSQNGGVNGHEGHPGDVFNVSSPHDCQTLEEPVTTAVPIPTNPSVTPVPSQTASPSPSPSPTPQYGSPTPEYGDTNICHATGDPTQPYEFIQITDNATYILHANHPGDIFDVNVPEDCPTVLRKWAADDLSTNQKPNPLCQATGSVSNPFVIIHSIHSWFRVNQQTAEDGVVNFISLQDCLPAHASDPP